ncbi:hypothetical protein [Bradyrhizobium sp. SZCCHNR3118]|uniref:hypothetical protein n=1 Tax=Bradyrhizobium sp. SZCCHNR3118 TaxID=3057468 RepID=UPI002916BB88|nr:hypothetical protein [Bradyrhizobium sp. SZCCHNR3118]
MSKYKVSDWVKSAPVGSKGEFVGQVTGYTKTGYIVRDPERNRWSRTDEQLQPAEEAVDAPVQA